MSEEMPQWPDEVVAESFRAEIRARFEAHNAAYRAREEVELAAVLRDHPEKRGQPGYEVRDSGAWSVYQASEIRIDRNAVTIVLPQGVAVDIDLVYMFDWTTVSWCRAHVGATIVDGAARNTIEIILVATWDDVMDAKWRRDGDDRKRVLVELFEDDVRALGDFISLHAGPSSDLDSDPSRRWLVIRDRLRFALEPL